MRISWDTKIAILYISFVLMIVTLVSATFFHKSELVADNYYEQETTFQKRINATQAANALSEPLRIQEEGSDIVLKFPEAFSGQGICGSVHFYAAADAGADRTLSIQLPSGGEWRIRRAKLAAAAYEAQISWAAGGKDYYSSIPLNLR